MQTECDAAATASLSLWLPLIGTMVGAVLGGGLALLGGWLTDFRRARNERRAAELRERALLTGMYAVRNHVAERINEWNTSGLTSALAPLRSAHRYVEKLIDKTPVEGEALMIAVIEVGLKLDSVLDTIDRRGSDPGLATPEQFARMVTTQMEELMASLEQFDLIAHSTLSFLSAEDLDAILEQSAPRKD